MIPDHPGEWGRGRFYFGTSPGSGADWMPIIIPPSARRMDIYMVGAGGNGGAGASAASGAQRGGGGGGGSGAYMMAQLPTALIPGTIWLSLAGRGTGAQSYLGLLPTTSNVLNTLPAGGTGGTGTTSAAGAAGSAAGIGSLVPATTLMQFRSNGLLGAAGGLGNAIGGTILNAGTLVPSGGAGGSGVSTTGQWGGNVALTYPLFGPNNLQVGSGGDGMNGLRLTSPMPMFSGGSGGGSNDAGSGGRGGDGGPGCGGGGGGAGVTGGAGGVGGEAWAWVMFS